MLYLQVRLNQMANSIQRSAMAIPEYVNKSGPQERPQEATPRHWARTAALGLPHRGIEDPGRLRDIGHPPVDVALEPIVLHGGHLPQKGRHQRGFTFPGTAHNGSQRASRNLEVDVLERGLMRLQTSRPKSAKVRPNAHPENG